MKALKISCVFMCLIVFVHLKLNAQSDNQSDTVIVDTTYSNSDTSYEESDEKEIDHSNDTTELRTISNEEQEKMKQDKDFIYSHKKIEPKKNEPPKANDPHRWDWLKKLLNPMVFKTILFALIGFILAFILYKLFFDSGELLTKRRKKTPPIQTETDFENVEVFSKWEHEIQKALAIKNYRLAVRIFYLQTLQELHQHSLIRFQQEKTNWQYVAELQPTHRQKEFMQLTTYFDYVWYGHFEIDELLYAKIEPLFKNFQQKINTNESE